MVTGSAVKGGKGGGDVDFKLSAGRALVGCKGKSV
jgi:hypothetical protein